MLFDFLVQIYGGTADRTEDQQLGGSDLQEYGQSRHVNQVAHPPPTRPHPIPPPRIACCTSSFTLPNHWNVA